MLENLRDKIINVQQDLSASFRNLTTGQSQQYRKHNDHYKGISPNAGGDLLHYYQRQWEELHLNDVENAKKAEEVDAVISNLHLHCQQQLSAVRQLNIQLCALPKLQTNVMDLMTKIGELEGVFEEVEDVLLNLEDLIETQELQERQLDHRFQLAMYKEKRLADFEHYKIKLAQEHTVKVAVFERKQQSVLKERQHTFQEAFEEELHIFKTQGMNKVRERVSSTSSAECAASLESIDLNDEVDKALDAFLAEELENSDVALQESEDFNKSEQEDSRVNEELVAP